MYYHEKYFEYEVEHTSCKVSNVYFWSTFLNKCDRKRGSVTSGEVQCWGLWEAPHLLCHQIKTVLLVFLLCLRSPQSERNQFDLLDYNMGSSKSVDLEDQFGQSVDFVEITFFPSTVCPSGIISCAISCEELLSGNPSFLALRWNAILSSLVSVVVHLCGHWWNCCLGWEIFRCFTVRKVLIWWPGSGH